MKQFAACIFTLFLALLAAQPAMAQKRVALVIGNDRYQNVGRLLNPVKDSRTLAATLRRMGYEVSAYYDLDRAAMRRAIVKFGRKARTADLAVVYFAGHGIEVNGENWLLPVDSRLRVDVDVEDETLALSFVMNKLRTTNRLGLVILDACRNNPFARQMTRSAHLTRAVKNGLARVEPRGNVLVAYAAREGTQAFDGASSHSPYAAALIKYLPTPGLDVRLLFGKVRDEVRSSTKGLQTPHIYGSLGGEEISLQKESGNGSKPATRSGEARLAYNDAKGDEWKLRDVSRRYKSTAYGGWARRDLQVLEEKRRKANGEFKVAVGIYPNQQSRWLKPGDKFDDCDGAGWCPSMVVVPKGSFMMGSKKGDSDEKPVHRVTFGKPFAVGRFEVTWDEWDACVSGGGCDNGLVKKAGGAEGWGKGTRPVINVSWNDAKTYLKWLKKKTGKSYRLLSEAEWEYVARAGSTGPFSWSGKISTAKANYDGNFTYGGSSKGKYRKKTVPVDSFKANAFGLYNVHGNVWEWVEDCYKDSYKGAPTDGRANTAGSCDIRVLRGGSWYFYPSYLRSAIRNRNYPVFRVNVYGFRVARSVSLARTR